MKKARYYFVALSMFMISIGFTKQNPRNGGADGKGLDVFLLIGQSNMSGVAPVGNLDTVTLHNVYVFNDKNQWEKAKSLPGNGLNRYSNVRMKPTQKFGPAYTFARKIADYTGKEIGVISNARGGSSLGAWQKGYSGDNDFDLYEEAVARTKAALKARPGSKIKAIIWHQGESDNSKAKSAAYIDNLKTLVADLRNEFKDENLPFIAGEVGTWGNRGKGVNPQIRKIKENISHTDWVTSDGLTSINVEKNDAHFDTYSQRVLGGRYADKALELVYKISPGSVVIYSGEDYAGRWVTLKAGDYTSTDLESMGIGNKEIASVKVDSNSKVYLFPGDFNTKPYIVSESKSNLGRKGFCSLKIVKE